MRIPVYLVSQSVSSPFPFQQLTRLHLGDTHIQFALRKEGVSPIRSGKEKERAKEREREFVGFYLLLELI